MTDFDRNEVVKALIYVKHLSESVSDERCEKLEDLTDYYLRLILHKKDFYLGMKTDRERTGMLTTDFNFQGPGRRLRNFKIYIYDGTKEDDGQIWIQLRAETQRTGSKYSWWETSRQLGCFPELTIFVADEHPA